MNTSENDKCERCGAAVGTTPAGRLCAACLLSGALGPTETVTMTPAEWVPAPGPAEYPCEFGNYRLLGLLGRGGMGVVYEAEDAATGRRLALKMLGRQLDSPEMRQRFLREGRLAARVNDPHSLYIFGSEEIEGRPVITMEIAGGGTLKDKLKERGRLPVAEAVDAILDVIGGLESAFAHGVLHRDIKPSNCFVGPDGAVKVGDFGLSVSTLAKSDSFVTVHGKIMGTPAYAAPEQLRGDALDLRADIYSVGATLFTLLTDQTPFEGENAIQVVANAVNQEPPALRELREDVPEELEAVVMRCLAKEPDGRYGSYPALRNALLPFSSREPEPASMAVRAAAGWIDYLIAFLPPYLVLMFLVGGGELFVRPLVERTLYSARYYFLLFGCGFLYFTVTEGIWGAGLGKRLKGLRVVRTDGRAPGLGRALLRIVIPLLCVEGVRMPLMLALIREPEWSGTQTALFVLAAVVCGWIPAVLALRARRENGFATVWDLVSGTRVLVKPKGSERPRMEPAVVAERGTARGERLGPYRIDGEIVRGDWVAGADPVLRRRVWLLRRRGPAISAARQNAARPGRPRWLQKVVAGETVWDAFEAAAGVPYPGLVTEGRRVPWSTLRHWLHDLASELWAAAGDGTLPAELSLDHVWITTEGRAVVLDAAWPADGKPAERMAVGDVAGQQRLLAAVAAGVEQTGVPLHARGLMQNLKDGKFEKLSFLAGTLRGVLDRPAEVSRGIRAGAVFLLPVYAWIAFFVGRYHDKPWLDSPGESVALSALVVLGAMAVAQLLALPFGMTASNSIFRLAVINARGEAASRRQRLARWAIVWLPVWVGVGGVVWLSGGLAGMAWGPALVVVLLWCGAAGGVLLDPHRGWHDRLAGTWVVRR